MKRIVTLTLLSQSGLFRRWLWLLPLAIVVAALEMVGLALVFAFVQMLDPPGADGMGRLGQALKDSPLGSSLLTVALAVAGVYLFKNILKLFEVRQREEVAAQFAVKLSGRLLQRYLHAPLEFHLQRNSGDLIRNVRDSVDRVAYRGLLSGTAVISEALAALGVLGFVIYWAPVAALLAATVVVGATAIVLQALQRRHRDWGQRSDALHGDIIKHLQQSLQGLRELKVLQREDAFVDDYTELRSRLGRVSALYGTGIFVPRLTVEVAFMLGLVALVAGVQLMGGQESGLLALLGLFALAGLRLLPSLSTLSHHLAELRFAGAAVDRVRSELQAVPDVEPDRDGGKLQLERTIELSGVSYRYAGAERDAVADIGVRIERGESIGIVGRTGSGKSTLVNLLLGLLSPTAGRVLIDGQDLAGRERSWQRSVGYVAQEVFLLDATIEANIALAAGRDGVDRARVEQAAAQAQLSDFLAGLEAGYDTVVGERGARISGGERQRLAIARALYRDPDVLVFDEATASLDTRTERALSDALRLLHAAKTLIVIAHRLNTVRRCDRILFLDAGRIQAIGSFDELMSDEPRFAALVREGDVLT